MQPLLHFCASGPEKCNPYCILEPREPIYATPIAFWALAKNEPPTAFWPPRARKMQPLFQFGPLEPPKCNPYCILGPRGPNQATPIAFWTPQAAKMQPLLHCWASGAEKYNHYCMFGASGTEKGNPYCILGPSSSKNATPIAFWRLGPRNM